MTVKSLAILAALAAMALLSSWFVWTLEASLREDAAVQQSVPPLAAHNLLMTQMTVQGLRRYTLMAPYAIQLAGDQGIQVERPALDMFRDGLTREWLLRAERAWISPDSDRIRLENVVYLVRPASSGEPPVVIATRNVWVHPAADYLETQAPVKATTPEGEVDAVGFKAYLNEDRLELLSNVRGYYAPPQP